MGRSADYQNMLDEDALESIRELELELPRLLNVNGHNFPSKKILFLSEIAGELQLFLNGFHYNRESYLWESKNVDQSFAHAINLNSRILRTLINWELTDMYSAEKTTSVEYNKLSVYCKKYQIELCNFIEKVPKVLQSFIYTTNAKETLCNTMPELAYRLHVLHEAFLEVYHESAKLLKKYEG